MLWSVYHLLNKEDSLETAIVLTLSVEVKIAKQILLFMENCLYF